MRTDIWRHFDFWLLGAVAVVTIFGVAMINSAIAGNEVLAERVPSQIIFAAIGFTVLIFAALIDYHYWTSFNRLMYVAIAIMLLIIRLLGAETFGAVRWISVGLITIQPSELAKIVMILILADFFAQHQHQIHDLRWIIRSLLLTMGMVFWIFIQPDLSTSIVLLVIWFALLWATGLQLRHLALFAGVGLLVVSIGFPFLEDYQQQRIFTFVFPNPEARFGDTYNVTQALISIGSGGWLGQGYGQGNQVQLRFLKVPSYRLHLFSVSRGIRLRWHHHYSIADRIYHLALPEGCQIGSGYVRRVNCLWRCHRDFLPHGH